MSEQIVGKIEHLTTIRSKPMVNMTDDMVKVELVMSRNDWRRIKKSLKNLST